MQSVDFKWKEGVDRKRTRAFILELKIDIIRERQRLKIEKIQPKKDSKKLIREGCQKKETNMVFKHTLPWTPLLVWSFSGRKRSPPIFSFR